MGKIWKYMHAGKIKYKDSCLASVHAFIRILQKLQGGSGDEHAMCKPNENTLLKKILVHLTMTCTCHAGVQCPCAGLTRSPTHA